MSGTAESGSPDLEGLSASIIPPWSGDGDVFAEDSGSFDDLSGDDGVSSDPLAVIEGLLVDVDGLVKESEEPVLGLLEVPLTLCPPEFVPDGRRREANTLGNVTHRPSAGPLEGEEGCPPWPLLGKLLIETEAGLVI